MCDTPEINDIPFIITTTTTTPETNRCSRKKRQPKRSTDSKICNSDSRKSSGSKSPKCSENYRRKSRNIVGGSLKYEIRRTHSILSFPVKWSSVRMNGTGFCDSRRSVIKIEPCNGIPNMNLDYHHMKSPTQSHMKNNIGNVSFFYRTHLSF